MKFIKYILLLSVIINFTACDFFSTRTPEPPDTGKNTFRQPTSADIVINNFINSIIEINSENYLSCFSDSSGGNKLYTFSPSNQALSKFPELFTNWDRMDEYRVFNSIVNNLKKEKLPELILANGGFDIQLPDSAIYITDYFLTVPHSLLSIPIEYSGTMQLTLMPNENRLWSITRWLDLSSEQDTGTYSWSLLKAAFPN